MGSKIERYKTMLLTPAKNHSPYPILDNVVSSFRHSYSNNADRHQQQYLSESSFLTDPNYLQNEGSRLDTIIETETKEQPKSPFIKRILLLTDIYMPNMNGFQLCEKILELDVNMRVCFMSALEVNIRALREVYRNVGFGCFIEKPVSIKYLIEILATELD